MAQLSYTVRVTIKNRKACRALAYAAHTLAEMAESQPWNTEAVKAAKAARYAMRHMKPEIKGS